MEVDLGILRRKKKNKVIFEQADLAPTMFSVENNNKEKSCKKT